MMIGRRRGASVVGAAACVVGLVMAVVASLLVLTGHVPTEIAWSWPIPFGSFRVGLDGLSAFFAGTIALVFFLPSRATLDALVRRDGRAGEASS